MSFDPTPIDPITFTRNWIAAWNRRDIDAVLAHYAETAIFVTPKADSIIGRGEVRGKAELRQYWATISGQINSLVFTPDRALWDPQQRVLTMLYVASIDGVSRRATEIVTFNADGLIERGEALYGAFIVGDDSTVDA
ncbi:MAG TPA: nuclear transport factor 2 family protein [Dongiaceae bacterium]|nr:nuclear transport factor 2 family protein [Dongiaceae bacterium]